MSGGKIYPNALVMADKYGAGYCQVTRITQLWQLSDRQSGQLYILQTFHRPWWAFQHFEYFNTSWKPGVFVNICQQLSVSLVPIVGVGDIGLENIV